MNKTINTEQVFKPEGFKSYWAPEVTDDSYHADKTFINSSSIKKMVKSPKAFFTAFFLNKNEEPTPAMKFGTLAHMAMLQGSKFKDRYVIMPEFVGYTLDGRPSAQSKDAKEKKAKWLSEQDPTAIITTEEDRERLFAMIDSLLSHEQASKLLSNGQAEVAGYWRDQETGLGLRIKPDFLSFDLGASVDVKTTADSVWESFRRSVENYRYDIQASMYEDGIHQITGKKPDHTVWIAIESQGSYEVACFEVPPQYQATGHFEYAAAKRRIKDCIEKANWPPRQQEIEYGEMSPWFFKQYELKGAFNDFGL